MRNKFLLDTNIITNNVDDFKKLDLEIITVNTK